MNNEIPFLDALVNGQIKLSQRRNPVTNAKERAGCETGYMGKDRSGKQRPNAACYFSVWKVEGDTAHCECRNAWGAILDETRPLANLAVHFPMVSVRVNLADGTHYITSASGNCTDKEIEEYFVGQTFDRGAYPQENMVRCVSIEIMR